MPVPHWNSPGYYRPEKQWDLIVVVDGKLLVAVRAEVASWAKFRQQLNNRAGKRRSAMPRDIWTADRQGLLGVCQAPFLGYLFLLGRLQLRPRSTPGPSALLLSRPRLRPQLVC